MDKRQLKRIQTLLSEKKESICGKQILVGFDGYVDKLVRLKKNQEEPVQYFRTVKEFADYIGMRREQSSDIEVTCTGKKLGGNGPLFAEAISRKEIPCICIGAMGYPDIEAEYLDLSRRIKLVSLVRCAESYAMEFDDGKLMFGDSSSFYQLDWNLIQEKVPQENLHEWFEESQVLMFANWSGLPHSNDILRGILRGIAPTLSNQDRYLFFDLADPSAKSERQFQEFFSLMKELRCYYHIILGLNKKECIIVYQNFFGKEAVFSNDMMVRMIEEMPIDCLSVHVLDRAYVGEKGKPLREVISQKVEYPKVVTGGGDNFNAGYCTGILLGFDPCDCACLGNLSSMMFVKNGISPSLKEIENYIDNEIDRKEQ